MAYISEISPIYIQRFYSGWITLRNQLLTPIRTMGRRIIELYDALLTGNDFEVTPALSLKRRAGHTFFCNINSPAQLLYSWKTNTQGTIPIIATTTDVEYVDTGLAAHQIKANTSGNAQSSVLGIGNFLYVGNPNFNFKYDGPQGTQGVTQWGISAVSTFSGGGSAQQNCGNGANIVVPSGSLGSANWQSPGNIAVTGQNTTCVTQGAFTAGSPPSSFPPVPSNILEAYNFGFSGLPSGTIAGVQVKFTGSVAGAGNPYFNVALLYNGAVIGSPKSVNLNAGVQAYTLGGNSDSWASGLTITQAQNSTSTGFAIGLYGGTSGSNAGSALQNNFTMYSPVTVTLFIYSPLAPSPTGSGTFSAVNGYVYVVAYGNSVSGEISNASLPSNNTGPFTSQSYVGVPVVASTDPQVNQIRVYRTTDTGGGNQFFEISNSPFANTTATIQDTTPDTSLQVTSQAEVNLGNTPPPAGLTNLEFFAGRMWGSVGNILYASTGPETISGKAPNSNWNPTYQYVIPGILVRNVRGPNGMLVFSQDDCYIVRGTDIGNYTVNEFVKDFGIRTYNAIDTDGTNIYVFTSDRQFIQLTASGANDIGLAIGDQLLNVDPSKVYVKVNRFGLDSIVRILDTANNVYYDYNLNQQCWNLPGILQMPGCTAMGSIETAPGVWRLMLSTSGQSVSALAFRDITNFQDLGVSYQPNAVFGSIQIADPGNIGKIGARGGIFLEMTNKGTLPTVLFLPNDIGADLTQPVGSQILPNTFVSLNVGNNPGLAFSEVLGAAPKNYRAYRWYILNARVQALMRHLQFQIAAPAENTAFELLGFGIFGDEKGEVTSSAQLPQIQGR